MIDDVVEGLKHAVGEPVVAHELPEVLDRVELGRARGQEDDRDIGRDDELVGGVPTRLIDEQDGMGARGDGEGYLGEMQGHRFEIAEGQDQARRLARGRTDGAEDIGRLGALIVRRRGARAALGPAPGALVLLADAGLVLEPDLYRRAGRLPARDLCQNRGEVFLKSAAAAGFCAWWRGRAESLV